MDWGDSPCDHFGEPIKCHLNVYIHFHIQFIQMKSYNFITIRAAVVAQLVERALSIPEVRGLNPVVGQNLYIEKLFTVSCIEKTKIKKKVAGNGPFKKNFITIIETLLPILE